MTSGCLHICFKREILNLLNLSSWSSVWIQVICYHPDLIDQWVTPDNVYSHFFHPGFSEYIGPCFLCSGWFWLYLFIFSIIFDNFFNYFYIKGSLSFFYFLFLLLLLWFSLITLNDISDGQSGRFSPDSDSILVFWWDPILDAKHRIGCQNRLILKRLASHFDTRFWPDSGLPRFSTLQNSGAVLGLD